MTPPPCSRTTAGHDDRRPGQRHRHRRWPQDDHVGQQPANGTVVGRRRRASGPDLQARRQLHRTVSLSATDDFTVHPQRPPTGHRGDRDLRRRRPVAVDDTGTTDEDSDHDVAAPGVLANDTDVEGDSLTVVRVNGLAANVGTPVTLASGAIVTLNSDGSTRTTRTARSRSSTPARPTPTPSPTGPATATSSRTPPPSRSRSTASTTRRSRSTTRARPTRTATSSSPPRACSPMTPTSRATA